MDALRGRLRRPMALLATLLALLPRPPAHAGALASIGHAASAQHADGPAPVRARHHGGFYRISGHGRVAWLFGTIDVGQASFYRLAREAQRCYLVERVY